PIKNQSKLTFVIPAVVMFLISLSGCSKKPIDSENLNISANDKNAASTSAITVNVKTDYGAVGNGIADDTDNFNAAITAVHNAGGGSVYVPIGTYLIDPDVSINMKSNVLLDMVDSLRIIKVKPTSSERYNVIRIHNRTNSRVKGGKILGERYSHIGTTGEWGMGISIYGSTNCRVDRTVITNCWGDGIVVGGTDRYPNSDHQSVNCVIKEVRSRNNRRQGLTIGAVDSLIVSYCKFMSTNGAAPEAGIDIAPDNLPATRIHIQNCEIAYNDRVGVLMYKNTNATSLISQVTVEGNNIHHNGTWSGQFTRTDRVKFYWNLIQNNGNNGFSITDCTNMVTTPNSY
ncbi:MAG TPA: glycosyl hydrolase family 28-related protein, partial [Sphingobacteriaceae bacterium]